MKNWLGYLYKVDKVIQTSKQQNSVPFSPSNQLITKLQTQILKIQQYFQKIDKSPILQQQVCRIEDVIGTIRGLLQFITTLKENLHNQEQKLSDYQKMKNKLENHHSIVNSMQQTYESQIKNVYKQKNQLQEQLRQQIDKLKQQNEKNSQEIKRLKQKHQQQHQKILSLVNENKFLQQKCQKISKQHQTSVNKLNSILQFDKNTKPKIISLQQITLNQIFYYKKLRLGILKYLQVKDIYRLRLLNKEMNYILNHSIKAQILQNIIKQYNKNVLYAKKDVLFYQKIFQQFAEQKIRQNAIKYLFFKIKPGQYMLPLFQQDFNKIIENLIQNSQENQQISNNKSQSTSLKTIQEKPTSQKSIKGTFKSFFSSYTNNKAKQQSVIKHDIKNNSKFTLDMLKNQKQFKNIQKKVDQFFQKIFTMKLPTDLQNFNFTMRQQLSQIKDQIELHKKQVEQLSSLYCFSKFLYIQANQMNNLLQTCFGMLVQASLKMKNLQNELQNKVQNQKVMRNMVEQLINDKNNMEKRIWSVQNQILRNKQDKIKIKSTIAYLQKQKQENQQVIQKMKLQMENLKICNEQLKRSKKQLQISFNLIRQQIKQWSNQN